MDTSIKDVLDNLKSIIQSDDRLGYIEDVVLGTKSKGRPNTPCVWVMVNDINLDEYSVENELYTLQILCICLDKSNDSNEVLYSTIKTASTIKDALYKNESSFGDNLVGLRCKNVRVDDANFNQQGSVTASTLIVDFKINDGGAFYE